MANQPPPNVQFSEWVTQWERAFNEFSNEMMGTEEFSKQMNQLQGMQLEMQRNFSQAMAQQLALFNIPSRDEVLKVFETLTVIDRRLLEIERKLDALAGAEAAPAEPAPGPARTRKPPSAAKEASGE